MAKYKFDGFTYSQQEIDEKVESLDTTLDEWLSKPSNDDVEVIEDDGEESLVEPVVQEDFQTDIAQGADVVSTDVAPVEIPSTDLDSVDGSLVSQDQDQDPKTVLTQKEFDNILPEGDDIPNEDDIKRDLNSILKNKGVGVRVDIPFKPGLDVISLTNIETGETTEIPLFQNNPGKTQGSMQSIKNPEAYNKIAEFLKNNSKTSSVIGNVYKNTGLAPEDYFTEEQPGFDPNMDSVSTQIELSDSSNAVKYDADQMNTIADKAAENFINAFKDPSLVGLNLEDDRIANYNYSDDEMNKLIDAVYEDVKIDTELNFSKRDFAKLYGTKSNLINTFKRTAIIAQTKNNIYKNNKEYSEESRTNFKNQAHAVRLEDTDEFDTKLYEVNRLILSTNKKISDLKSELLQGPPEKVSNGDNFDEKKWYDSINVDIETEQGKIKSYRKQIDTNAKLAAKAYANSQSRQVQTPGGVPKTIGYKEAYNQKYKELSDLNFVGGKDAFTRSEERKTKGDIYNQSFDSVKSAFSDYLTGLRVIDRSLTTQEGAELFADTKYTEKLDILTDARNENIRFKFTKAATYRKKSMMSNEGFTTDDNGYYDISVFDYQRLFGNKLVFNEIEKSDDDQNKIKIFKDNLDAIDGELDAVWETIYLNKDIENIKSDSNLTIFGGAAIEALADTIGLDYDAGGTIQLKRNIEALNSEYNEVYARDIIDGKMPAAQFTPKQLEALKTTFGQEFSEMAGGFVPLFGEIMALTAATGGVMNYLGAAKWIQKALTSNTATAWEKLSATMVTGGIEEAKMRLLGFPPGTGAIFGVSGVLAKGVRISNSAGGQSVLDPFFQNGIKTAVMGVAASEVSHILEKYLEGLKGNESFMASFDELYGDMADVSKRVALNGLLFGGTGVFHMKGTDFIGTNQINKTIRELYTKRLALIKKPKRTAFGENFAVEMVDRKLTAKEKNLVKSYDQSINNLQKVVELRNGGALISIDDPDLQKTLQTKSMDPITNILKKGGGNIKSGVLTVVSDPKVAREKLWDADKGVEVPARFNDLGNGKYEILVNKRLANKMIEEGAIGSIQDLINHEMTHYVRSVTTKKFPNSQPRILGNVMNRMPKIDGLGKGGLRRLKRIIEKAYEKDGVAMSENMSQEEQLAYVAQIFSRPELYYTAEAPTFITEVIKDIKYNFSLMGYKGNPPTNSSQIASYFFEALREMKSGKAEKFVDMLAPEMNALADRSIQFVERGNGTIGIVVDEKTTQRDSKLINAEEVAVKKESYVVTNELFKDRKGWNNGKPTKEFLKTLDNEKDKALILEAAQPVFAASMKRLYTSTLEVNRNEVTYEQFKKDFEQEYLQRFLDYDVTKVGEKNLPIAEQTSNLYNLRINKLGTEQFNQTKFTSSIDNLTISEQIQVQQGYGETFTTTNFEKLDLSPGSAGRSGIAKTNKKINVLDGLPTNRIKDAKGETLPKYKSVIEKMKLDMAGLILSPDFIPTFKGINDLARRQGHSGELLGEMSGIDANAIRNSNKNFNNSNQKKALRFLLDPANLKWSLRTMQEANTPVQTVPVMGPKGNPVIDKAASKEAGKTVFKTKLIGGMPTGIPRNIRDLLYESTGKEVNGNPQYRLKRNIDLKEIYNAMGITDGIKSVDLQGQGTRTTSESGKVMQFTKGMMTMINQAMNVKQAQDVGRKMGLDLQVIENMGKGKSKFTDSKNINELKEILIDEVKIKGGIGGQEISKAVVEADNIEADLKSELILEVAKDGVITSKQKDVWLKIIENNEKKDFENSGKSEQERIESEAISAKSTKELAESLFKEGVINRVANTSTAEVQKSPVLQEAQRNFDIQVLKELPSFNTMPKSSVRGTIKTLQHGTKSRKNVDGTYKSQKLNEVLDFYGFSKDGKTSEIKYELVLNKKTGKMEGKYDAFYISDFKKADFYKENKRLHDLVDSGKLTEAEAKTEWKEWSESKLSKTGYTYNQTKEANNALAQDYINGMYEVVRKAGTKEGGEFSWTPEAKQAMEMVVLTMGNQTSIAQGLIKAGFYNVESVAWNLSKPEFEPEKTKKERKLFPVKNKIYEKFNEGEAGYWEHEKQLLNTSRDIIKNIVKNIKFPIRFQEKQVILSKQAVQSLVPKNTQLRNDGLPEGGNKGYGTNMPKTPDQFTNFNRNTFKDLVEASNQIKLGETETISIADGLFNSMNKKQRIETLKVLSESSNLNPTGYILKGELENPLMVKEVNKNNQELFNKATGFTGDFAYKNLSSKEMLNVLKEKDNIISEEIKSSMDSKDLSAELNTIIREGSPEIKNYSSAKAKLLGKKIKDNIWIPASAEDFKGLIYRTLGKGKLGEKQFAWYKENLIDPLNKAETLAEIDRTASLAAWRGLKKQLKNVPKQLRKESGIEGFTNENAIRVYNWARQNMEVPGLSKSDLNGIIKLVDNNPEFVAFSDKLIEIGKGDGYPPPTDMWLTSTMATDLRNGLGSIKRANHLAATGFTSNIEQIYSKQNLNNLEAKYGTKYRTALENIIGRIKTGKNRKPSKNEWENRAADWLNGANAVTMSLNVKSGILQMTSSINFLNMSDNNPFMAGKAMANIPTFAAAIKKIWQSDYLQRRMGGDKIDVSQNEVAEAARTGGVKGLTNLVLQKGYFVTRVADAAAIASGGATFLVNRTNTYYKKIFEELKGEITAPKGRNFLSAVETRIKANSRLKRVSDWREVNKDLIMKEAEKMAFEDFRLISEQTQQSAATSMISSEQASISGRAILAFNNTPAQYTRITKRAVEDLMAGRGNKGEHIRKIIYYSVAQNLLFNGLSNAMFGDIWESDEQAGDPRIQQRKQDRNIRTVNGMLDTMLRGSGIKGAAVSTLKNMLIKVYNENKKTRPDYAEAALEALDFVPSLDTKIRKLRKAGDAISWNYGDIKKLGLMDSKNPAYLASSNVISAATNFPADRLLTKFNNVRAVMTEDMEGWQKVARALGWSEYAVGTFDIKQKAKKSKKSKNPFDTEGFNSSDAFDNSIGFDKFDF